MLIILSGIVSDSTLGVVDDDTFSFEQEIPAFQNDTLEIREWTINDEM